MTTPGIPGFFTLDQLEFQLLVEFQTFFTHEHLEGVEIPDFFCRNCFGIPGFVCFFLFFWSTALGIPDIFVKPVLEVHLVLWEKIYPL